MTSGSHRLAGSVVVGGLVPAAVMDSDVGASISWRVGTRASGPTHGMEAHAQATPLPS